MRFSVFKLLKRAQNTTITKKFQIFVAENMDFERFFFYLKMAEWCEQFKGVVFSSNETKKEEHIKNDHTLARFELMAELK